MKVLSNNQLTIKIKSLGAELSSIINNATQHEYLWQADPVFWKRHSPVLFPIVGGVWNNQYRHNEEEFSMSQHGFARDRQFELIAETSSEIRYRLNSDNESRKLYPFDFSLEIAYRLIENRVEVIWEVTNIGEEELHFQIGAHPAFYYPTHEEDNNINGYFSFDTESSPEYILIKEKGCVDTKTSYQANLENGFLKIDAHTFDNDALIFENSQIKKVTLHNSKQEPYLSLQFEAPLVGLWAPPHKDSPFVCIEPWYGRCDKVEYAGEFKDREWMNHLTPNQKFSASYEIIVE